MPSTVSEPTSDKKHVGSRLEELLLTIRDALAEQQKQHEENGPTLSSSSSATSTELRKAWQDLSEGDAQCSPREVLNVIVPYLFQGEGDADENDGDRSREGGSIVGDDDSKRMEIVDEDRPSAGGSRPWSSRDALAVLGFLVGCDANRYLSVASEVVRYEAQRIFHTAGATMAVSPELLSVVVHQLSSPSVSVSSNAATTLVTCCQTVGGDLRYRAISAVAEAWQQQHFAIQANAGNRNQASTIAVRCASSLVEILCLEEGTNPKSLDLAASTSSRVLLPMLSDASDPLVQMSTLDLIERMANTRPIHHWRAHWLFSEAVRDPILAMCGGSDLETSSPDPMLGGPALRVVAALCRIAHDGASSSELLGVSGRPILDGFNAALKNGYAASSGEMDRLALIDAISSFASASPEALHMVLNDPDIRRAWLSLSVAQPKLKSVVLYSVAMVLDPTRSNDASGEASVPDNSLGMRLFSQFGQVNGGEATDLVLSLAKSVLPEVRLSSYALLGAVAKLSTGGQLLFTHPDFLHFLLERKNESTKEGREARWDLVRTVLASPVTGLLAQDIVRKLETYVKEGPHYVKVQRWELATD